MTSNLFHYSSSFTPSRFPSMKSKLYFFFNFKNFFSLPVNKDKIIPVDLPGIPLDTFFIFPGGVMDFAFHVKRDFFPYIDLDDFGGFVPEDHLVPFGFLDFISLPDKIYIISSKVIIR